MRLASLLILGGRLRPSDLAQPAAAIVRRLDEPMSIVRSAAVRALERLTPSFLVLHGVAIAQRLGHSDCNVRLAALFLLKRLKTYDMAAAIFVEDNPGGTRENATYDQDELCSLTRRTSLHTSSSRLNRAGKRCAESRCSAIQGVRPGWAASGQAKSRECYANLKKFFFE